MPPLFFLIAATALGQGVDPGSPHSANPIFLALTRQGLSADGTDVRLPTPTFADGLAARASEEALKGVAGDDRAVKEFLRDSVTAPFVLKLRDVKAGRDLVRVADLWFAVHADLGDVDPDAVLRQADEKPVEVGNMRFESKILGARDLEPRKIEVPASGDGRKEWYTHSRARLLDKIAIEATDHAYVTRSPDSLIIATRTDRGFDRDPDLPNAWSTITRSNGAESTGPAQTYVGGASYAKITRFASDPGILLVESHLVFAEPREWFDGNPILRSKIGLVAQDQVRQLRREIARRRPKK